MKNALELSRWRRPDKLQQQSISFLLLGMGMFAGHRSLSLSFGRELMARGQESSANAEFAGKRPCLPGHEAESRMEHPAFAKHLRELVAGVRNLPIAPTIRSEIPIVEIAA